MQLLVVTSQTDVHADVVIKKLEGTDIEPIRLNTQSFIQKAQYHFAWDASGGIYSQALTFSDSLREVKDIKVIWWRKPDLYNPHPEVTDDWAIKYAVDETKALISSLNGLYPKAKWVNSYYNLRLPSQRINQIPIAKELGIPVPPTLVTNHYQAASDFLKLHGDCIVKAMGYAGFVHNEEQYSCYTRTINLETLDILRESIHLAPVFIQKRISKKAEYRVTLIGEQSFVCRIEADHLNDPYVAMDWRVVQPDKLIHVQDTLSESYLEKLHNMLRVFGLNYGAFDIIRDVDDTLYLIELNPNGQWHWMEILTGMPMADAMVQLIKELASD